MLRDRPPCIPLDIVTLSERSIRYYILALVAQINSHRCIDLGEF